jgi:hypothetical protein
MTRLGETSLLSAHFADNSRFIYRDASSCAPHQPKELKA